MGRLGGRARRVIPPGAKIIGKGKPRGGEPAALAALVSRAYPSREPEDIAALRAFTWWARAVPPRVTKNARPVRVHGGVLTVHATTSAWVSDLSFLQAQILQSIQRFAPGARIRELRLRPSGAVIRRRLPRHATPSCPPTLRAPSPGSATTACVKCSPTPRARRSPHPCRGARGSTAAHAPPARSPRDARPRALARPPTARQSTPP
jgi:hypothetical protein